MAVILNLETATTNCSVSIARDGAIVSIKERNTPNYSHSEQLHVFIQEVVEEASMTLMDVDAVAVSKGPGSYTGLRIGVSSAKGLCFALGKPLISIATLQSLASQNDAKAVDYIIPVLDARRMEVYAAVFDVDGKEIRATKAEVITADSFAEFAEKGRVHLIGNGATKCQEVLDNPNFSFDTQAVPSAKEMARLSFEKFQGQEFEDVAYFEPFYLKDFILQTKKG
ncbi:tRNA (adenosine(37)-N6)-threonylcarbamoyltransferase complex dimerization subunit type 1 TsaB [Maribacter sp. 2307UL18-2]|uniref:tRNA (adenosine(37)-N6)-threonylcarbamoyltransferase complex dimerization subunit type 1 TsaB n=1 Tax=Maribacter sp. 2307UL18-2 TaxID=3386274 RepID=UPI0039BD6802